MPIFTKIDSEVVTFSTKTCPLCGVHYAVDSAFVAEIKRLNESWYCPNGHSLVYKESPADQLERELKAAKEAARIAENNSTYFSGRLVETQRELDLTARTLKASKTRLKKTKERIAAGVCPCCRRNFENLGRHIRGQHPQYLKKEK